ncbi:S-layer homology domain-containing protein [Deinococcus roseus]|uniref:SLH domain-containing protein n=1 Tax=Deinococcus roseus TaxID=392414 RepID=A0ABQ2D9D9_9DEIO|nr:S-layer homology domain-containing protein [Deinococcus roseus]GGJ46598.1 hypothetical protein GCM10008938_35950 [Deinococcus roseus]
MKLRAVLAVTAALSFGGAFAQANFSDVPAGHWAKDAVEKMAAKGCIIGFPDGTYRGNESLTRYQAALILARCLQEVPTSVFGAEDIEALKNAVQELSSELAALGVRIADVEDNAATKEDVAALEERVAALEEGAGEKTGEGFDTSAIEDLQAQIDELAAADEATAGQIEELTGALDDLVAQLDDLGSRVDDLTSGQEDLVSRVEALEGAEPVEPGDIDLSFVDDLTAAIDDVNARVDDLAAAQDDLLAAQDDLTSGQEELAANLEDLTATLDDLSASLDDLGTRVDDLAAAQDELVAANEETAALLDEINSRIEELAGAIDDVNVRVDDLEGSLGELGDTVASQGEQIEANTGSIVALQDLTVLFNEDIVSLEDRISTLESDKADAADVDARFTNLNRDLTDLTNRVTVVETNLSDLQGKFNTLNGTFGFSVSGELTSVYYVSRVTTVNFDIDRIISGTQFSSGVDSDTATADSPIDYVDFGVSPATATKVDDVFGYGVNVFKVTVDTDNTVNSDGKGTAADDANAVFYTSIASDADVLDVYFHGNAKAVVAKREVQQAAVLNGSKVGNTSTDLTLKLDFANKGISGTSANSGKLAADTQAFNVHSVTAEFGLSDLTFSKVVTGDATDAKPVSFYIKGVTVVFDVNGAPIKFNVGENVKTQFTEYVFDNNVAGIGDGFVATVDGSSLPGIGAFKPTLTVAYGSEGSVGGVPSSYNRGIRATISPVTDVNLGVSAAQWGTDSMYAPDSLTDTVFGADLKAKIAGWNVQSEFATETFTSVVGGVTTTDNASIFYAHADGTAGPLTVRADVWNLDPDFDGVSYDSGDDHKNPYNDIQVVGTQGAYVNLKATLGAFKVGGYFDRIADFDAPADTNMTGFGVDASGQLSIFKVGAYFDNLAVHAGGVDVALTRLGATAGVTLGGFDVNGYFQTVSVDGVTVVGTPAIPYAVAPFKDTQTSKAGVDITGKLASVNLKAGFKLDSGVTDLAGGAADWDRTTLYAGADTTFTAGVLTVKPSAFFESVQDADVNASDHTQVLFAVDASTSTLDTFLRPSFTGYFGYKNTAYSDADYTSSMLEYSLGVKSSDFLFPKSTLAFVWAGETGTNMAYDPFVGDVAGGYYDVDTGDLSVSLGGVYVEWTYNDLNFAYGDFTLNQAGFISNGQAFKVSYKVKF